jgi:hypothetical protein
LRFRKHDGAEGAQKQRISISVFSPLLLPDGENIKYKLLKSKTNNYLCGIFKNCNMEIITKKVVVEIPPSDLTFFKQLADKMGWQVTMQQDIWAEHLKKWSDETELLNDDTLLKNGS